MGWFELGLLFLEQASSKPGAVAKGYQMVALTGQLRSGCDGPL